MIPFFKLTLTGNERKYLDTLLDDQEALSGKRFIHQCEQWFRENHGTPHFYLTKSCTHSLELAALALDIQPGDEVIMPSYAFVSCANAFALRGATCVFVDIHPHTMNLDESQVEKAITHKTKAILTLNYAGVACSYEALRAIADKYHLYIVEDNAHGIGATHRGTHLGVFGDIATFSFDHLKNVTCIQGGGIAVNNEKLLDRFYVTYEFGTNRRSFFNGHGDRYEWKGLGSNFPLSELSAAMFYAQLQEVEHINQQFVSRWNQYAEELNDLAVAGKIEIPHIPKEYEHNGHCFYLKTKTAEQRKELIEFLAARDIQAQFHYTPLHASEFGKTRGRATDLSLTESEAGRLLRLPLYYGMSDGEQSEVIASLKQFFEI